MTAKDRVLQLLQWTRERTNDLIKDIPDDKAAFQPSKTSNSAIWCLGHMALTDE